MLNARLDAMTAYLKQVGKSLARGDSAEHTHRLALQDLIEQLQTGIVCVGPLGPQAVARRHCPLPARRRGNQGTIRLMAEMDKAIPQWPME
jgi:hypothetical protein